MNHLTTTMMHIRRAPFAAATSVLTLALGLVCFITAYAVVGFWNRSEQHFANVDRIFSVSTDLESVDGSVRTGEMPLTSEHMAEYLKTDYPKLDAVARARLISENAMVSAEDRAARLFRVAVDPAFLEIFDLPFIAGDPKTALSNPRSVVLTQQGAERLFGDEDPLGRHVLLSNSIDATVTGVIAPIPEPSHMGRSASASLRFDLLSSYDLSDSSAGGQAAPPENWLLLTTTTYVMLPDDDSFSAADLSRQLDGFAARHIPPEQLAFARLKFDLLPVTSLLIRAGSGSVFVSRTGLSMTSALLLLGGLVLAVACINYANLATAGAASGAREVGVRKLLGAKPLQIAAQHLLDAGVLTAAASVVALASTCVIAPVLKAATGIDLRLALLDGAAALTFSIGLFLLVTLFAGAYPAFVLSRLRPISALRAERMALGPRALSTLLVGLQFSTASLLLVGAIVTYQQNEALRQTGLQLGKDPLVVIENFYTATHLHPDTLLGELISVPQVSAVTSMSRPPWTGVNVLPLSPSPDEAATARSALWYTVGHDFFSTFEVDLLAGRVFDRDRGDDALPFLQDSKQGNNIVIDRSLQKELGFRSPEEAVGNVIYIPRKLVAGFGGSAAHPLRIVGVVEDRPLTLIAIGPRSSVYSFATPLPFQVARISRVDVAEAVAEIDALWKRLLPHIAIRRRFADDFFREGYANFERINQALSALAMFALLIAAIGLFAMAAVVTTRRRREVAVRKVLGASVKRVIGIILTAFAKPVLIASIIAWPLAYIGAQAYLDSFVEPVALTFLPFLLCLLALSLIVGLTVCGQAVRAARLPPASVLRDE